MKMRKMQNNSFRKQENVQLWIMSNLLTSEERSELLLKHKSERDKRMADRIKVILLFDQGWNFETIAKALF